MADRKVIGIGYDLASDAAPTVLLKGSGSEAELALEQARRLGDIPIVKDPQLVEQLYRVPVDAAIGRDLFVAMAAVLAHVIQLDREQGEGLR
jgi:flagellar biosynthesis protein